ncbi:putative entry exclusion protein TrbK-alt [Sphingobium sp. BS19]|uniref:putative entry exclusion protein TrbK-alt n=1 Tax=Sphingobium sp. BS19 TaxID=3018973 RepID=UPI002492F3D6|nr:putative entry exclusion protein TrbK-alt [Sphingobium sp. BS19]
MSRSVKLAAVAAFGGLLIAVAVVSTTQPPARHDTTTYVADETGSPNPHAAELKRCSTITMPESGCDAVWEAERRRFFHGRDRQP